MKNKQLLIILSFLVITFFAAAQSGSKVVIDLDNYEEKQLRFAYYLGDQLYVKDSLVANKKGNFVYESKEALHPGMYALVLSPDNRGMEFLVNAMDQNFKIKGDATDLNKTISFEGSEDNQLFSDYIKLLGDLRPLADSLGKIVKEKKEAKLSSTDLEYELDDINVQVENYKKKVLNKHPKTLTASILRSQEKTEFPKFEGTDKEIGLQQFLYRRDHYFDLIRKDTAFYRTKAFNGMVNYYMDKLVVAHPDSITKGVDEVLGIVATDIGMFRFYFIKFINQFGKMKMVGHDAVYVHMVEEYSEKGRTPFLPEEQLEKAIKTANKTKITLIGKTAPNIDMKRLDIERTLKLKDQESEHQRFKVNETIPLHDVKSPYTVLFFWKPNCPACKKAVPKLVEFYEKYKDKGVEIYACPTKTYKDMPKVAKFLKDNNATEWINAVDPYFKTKFMTVYHVETTPRIYILDENKKIVMNRIGAEQIAEVMDGLLKELEGGEEKEKLKEGEE
ncbi:MAG: thiol-disulfide isomerase/thioredoxin [Polaribacter sp.]|jgi:thiol-disulfide isomerase/thioredoxin